MKLCRAGLHDLDDPKMVYVEPSGGRRCGPCKRRHPTAWVMEKKAARGCTDCGEHDPIVLDWHHILGGKSFTIGGGHRFGRIKLSAEMEKCIVLCANCHRRRHAD